jgi:hypothetical protein
VLRTVRRLTDATPMPGIERIARYRPVLLIARDTQLAECDWIDEGHLLRVQFLEVDDNRDRQALVPDRVAGMCQWYTGHGLNKYPGPDCTERREA